MDITTLLLALLALVLGGSGGGGIAYVVTKWLLRQRPSDSNIDQLVDAVDKLIRQQRQRRMREVRNGLTPEAEQEAAPAGNLKDVLRARLRARRGK